MNNDPSISSIKGLFHKKRIDLMHDPNYFLRKSFKFKLKIFISRQLYRVMRTAENLIKKLWREGYLCDHDY